MQEFKIVCLEWRETNFVWYIDSVVVHTSCGSILINHLTSLLLFKQVGNTAEVNNEAANSMMQKFWDSAMALTPDDDEETRRLWPAFLICSFHLTFCCLFLTLVGIVYQWHFPKNGFWWSGDRKSSSSSFNKPASCFCF